MLEHWQEGFLEVLRRTGNVQLAADRAGITRQGAYYHRRRRRDFARAWDSALHLHREKRKRESLVLVR